MDSSLVTVTIINWKKCQAVWRSQKAKPAPPHFQFPRRACVAAICSPGDRGQGLEQGSEAAPSGPTSVCSVLWPQRKNHPCSTPLPPQWLWDIK